MNTTYLTKSMNGQTSVDDGIISIENGVITFGDGTTLDTSDDITFKSLDNTLTGNNTFNNVITAPTAPTLDTHLTNLGSVNTAIATETARVLADDNSFTGTNIFDLNVFTLALAPEVDSHLTRKDYVDISIANETTAILGRDNTFTGNNTFDNPIVAPISNPLLATHLTNKSYVDGAIATETASILASDNTFTGINTISNTTISSEYTNGALVVSGGVGIAGNLRVNGRCIFNDILAVYNDVYFSTNLLVNELLTVNGTTNLIGTTNLTGTTNASNLNVSNDLTVSTNAYVGDIAVKSVIATPIQTGSSSYAYFTSSSLLVSSVSTGYEYALSNGVPYEVIYSTIFSTAYDGYKMFNNDLLDPFVSNAWACASSRYSTSTGLYTGSVSTTTDIGAVLGEYNQIKLPYPLKLTSFKITNVVSYTIGRAKNFVLLGSNDGTNWTTILSSLVSTGTINIVSDFTTTNNTFYFYFRIIVKDIYNTSGSSSYCGIEELKLYGEAYSVYKTGVNSDVINSILQINGDVGVYDNLYVNGTTNSTINRVRIMGSDNGTNQNSIIIDCCNNDIGNLVSSTGENVVIGKNNLLAYQAGTYNVAVGVQNLQNITTQSYNVGVGYNVFRDANTSGFNTGIGSSIFKQTTTGGYNIGVGYDVGKSNISGSNNVMIGYNGGEFSNGNNNVFIGNNAKTNNLGTYNNSTAIGQTAVITASNQMVLGTAGDSLSVVIPSTNSTALTVGGGVGIGGSIKTTNTTDAGTNGTGALVVSGGAYIAKHIQLPTTTAGIRLGDWNKGICYSNQSSLKTGNDAQYYNINDGIAVFGWADGCLGTRQITNGGDKSILYWNSLNQVGINTNSPTASLDVVGTGKFSSDLTVGGNCNIAGMFSAQLFNNSAGYTPPVIGSEFTFTSGTKVLIINFSCYASTAGKKTMTFQLTGSSLASVKQTFTQSFFMNQTGVHMSYTFSFKTNNLITTTNDTKIRGFFELGSGIVTDTNDYLHATIFNTGNNV